MEDVERQDGPEARLAVAVEEIFGPRCRAAWLSGSYVYRGARPGESDIDVVLLFADGVPIPADAGMQARIRAFVDVYLEVHARAGLDPDLEFPGEYMAAASLAETLAWRGLAMAGRVARRFPAGPSSDYWPGRPERWFNAWLSMTALSRFLIGDRAAWEEAKRAAWTEIVRFLLLRAGEGERPAEEDLWDRLDQFGVKPRYRALRAVEEEWLRCALAAVEAEGFARREDGRIAPDAVRLRAWEGKLAAEIARAGGAQGPLLLPPGLHAALGAHAARRWRALTDTGAPSARFDDAPRTGGAMEAMMDEKGRERVEGDMGEGSFGGSLSRDRKPAQRVPDDAGGREAPAMGWSTDRPDEDPGEE